MGCLSWYSRPGTGSYLCLGWLTRYHCTLSMVPCTIKCTILGIPTSLYVCRHVCDGQVSHTNGTHAGTVQLVLFGDSDEAIEMQDAWVTLLLDDCRQHMLATYLPACVWHRLWMGEGTQQQLSSCGAKLASWAIQKLNSGLAG